MAMITNDWLDAVKPEFSKEYYKDLFCFVKDEYSKCVVYPPADDIFNAFHFTPLSKVKVLILGQDPYHGVGEANGLAFSVNDGIKFSNINPVKLKLPFDNTCINTITNIA